MSASSSLFVESFFSVLRTMSASSLCGIRNVRTVVKAAFRSPSTRSIVMISFASSSTSPRLLVDHVLRGDPAERVRLLLGARAADLLLLALEEEAQDVPVGDVPESLEEHRHRELPLPVDVDVHDVVHVEAELDPRPAVRNDPGRVELLAARVNRLVEEDARRPVELTHDHALGAVDDEGPLVGDDRQLAEVDLLLDDALVPCALLPCPRGFGGAAWP